MNKFRAISLAVILGLSISSVPAIAVPKPTVAEIEAAKKVEAAKKKIADAQAKKLAAANQSLRALTAKANAAAAVYRKATTDHNILGLPPRPGPSLTKKAVFFVPYLSTSDWHQPD